MELPMSVFFSSSRRFPFLSARRRKTRETFVLGRVLQRSMFANETEEMPMEILELRSGNDFHGRKSISNRAEKVSRGKVRRVVDRAEEIFLFRVDLLGQELDRRNGRPIKTEFDLFLTLFYSIIVLYTKKNNLTKKALENI